jgi:hypothetical protein
LVPFETAVVETAYRADLREKLRVADGSAVFTTIQKFIPAEQGDRNAMLSDRRNIVVAQLRVYVKRCLRKHGYPPDKQAKATITVLEQAEVLSEHWAAALTHPTRRLRP